MKILADRRKYMDQFDQSLEMFIENAGWLAPILFVLLHIIRPFLFLPVIAVCVAGGVLFGFVEGAVLSFIGLSLMSFISYFLVTKLSRFRGKLSLLQEKFFHGRTLSVGQVMILRIMPFVHFHLLSFYLIEMTKSLKEYTVYSLLGLILPAVLYTAFGEAITELPWYATSLIFLFLAVLYQVIDKLNKSRPEFN